MGFRLEHVDRDHLAGVHEERMDLIKAVADHCADLRGVQKPRTDMRHVARVPEILVMKYINDNGITWSDFMRDPAHAERFLADPAIAHFRISRL